MAKYVFNSKRYRSSKNNNCYKIAQEEYKGEHQSPSKEDSAPLYDLTVLYPEDIYSTYALRYYGYQEPGSEESIRIIQAARNKPNMPVKIYRAVPNVNSQIEKQIKELYEIIYYKNKFNFFPMNNKIVYQLTDKYPMNDETTYDQQNEMIVKDINRQIEVLETQIKPKTPINSGDWVTFSLTYAKYHGKSNLNNNYKIVSKMVKAKELFTYADSINEWGYNP